jgi:hypothetical protein
MDNDQTKKALNLLGVGIFCPSCVFNDLEIIAFCEFSHSSHGSGYTV